MLVVVMLSVGSMVKSSLKEVLARSCDGVV